MDVNNEGVVGRSVSAERERRPFVLLWAEKAAIDKVRPALLTFSENIGGLEARSIAAGEHFETTGGPETEGADTGSFIDGLMPGPTRP